MYHVGVVQATEKEEAMDNEDVATMSRRSGDADVGLMALWGLLNLSSYAPAQVRHLVFGMGPAERVFT